MLLLVIVSFVSWVIIFLKAREISESADALVVFEDIFWSGQDLRVLHQELSADSKLHIHGIERIFLSGFQEFIRLQEQLAADGEMILAGANRNMQVMLSREDEWLSARLPFLATVGSVSPYVGLFGTVWGIINSFRSLAGASQVSLSSVAPGISEALIATAMGLLAAIPAVVAYNRFSDRRDRLVVHYQAFIEEFIGILYRRLHGRSVSKYAVGSTESGF